MLIPHYRNVVEWIIRLSDLMTACLLFLLIIAQRIAVEFQQSSPTTNQGSTADTAKPKYHLCALLAFVSIPCTLILAIILDFFRQRQIWSKLEKGELKHEIEMEHALYLLIEKMKLSLSGSNDKKAILAYSDILYLVDCHNAFCDNISCPCQRKEIVEYLLNKSNKQKSRQLSLYDEDINLLNSQLPNEFIKGEGSDQQTNKALTVLQTYNLTDISGVSGTSGNAGQGGLLQVNIIGEAYKSQEMHSSMVVPNDLQIDLNDRNQPEQSSFRQKTNGDHQGREKYVRVNIPSLQATFLTMFSEIFFEDARKRFPQSKLIFFQHLNFALNCCKNRYMVENLLRNLDQDLHSSTHTDWIDSVSTLVNELYIIMEIQAFPYNAQSQCNASLQISDDNLSTSSDFANWGISYYEVDSDGRNMKDKSTRLQNTYSQIEMLEPEQFIIISQLTEDFNNEIEKLARSVQYFWKLIQMEQFDVYHTQKSGIDMANTIASVFKIFKDIEDAVSDGKPGSKSGSNDFRVCFTFALMQKYLLNDIIQHDLYIAKMNSQREMRRLIRNNMLQSQQESVDDVGFLLAKGQSNRFGEVIICNQVFRKSLGFSSEDQQHMNIADFMPTMIKGWHNSFVQDFCLSGGASSQMLNNTTLTFMKKKNGYVTPVMMHLKFHYSLHCETRAENSMTFAMFVSFMQEIRLSKSSTHNIKDVMFFLCNDQDGQIMDLSESCSSILKFSQSVLASTNSEAVDINCLRVEDLLVNAPQILQDQSHDVKQNFEVTVDIDMDIISKLNGDFKNRRRYANQQTNMQRAILNSFYEQYGKPNYDQRKKGCNIVAITLLDPSAVSNDYCHMKKRINNGEKNDNSSELQRLNFEGLGGEMEGPDFNDPNMSSISADNNFGEEESVGQSQSSTSGPSNGNSTESASLKQLQATTEKTASGSLKLITQLIFGVFILLLILSTVNLTISLTRYSNLQYEVEIVRRSYDRVQIRAKLRILLRNILVAANGYGNTDWNKRVTRFNTLIEIFQDSAIKFKEVEKYLDQNTMNYEAGRVSLSEKTVRLRYLDADNNEQIVYETLSYSMNIFVQRFTDMMNWPMERFMVNISVMNLYPVPPGYRPSEDERTIYFVAMTGMGNIRTEARRTSMLLRAEAERNALDVAQKTELTIIISIVAIAIVCLIVSPIICRIEERKYMSLRFFLNVEPEHLAMLDEQVQLFIQLAFSDQHKSSSLQEQKSVDVEQKSIELGSQGGESNSSYTNDNNNFSMLLSSHYSRDNQQKSSGNKNSPLNNVQTARWAKGLSHGPQRQANEPQQQLNISGDSNDLNANIINESPLQSFNPQQQISEANLAKRQVTANHTSNILKQPDEDGKRQPGTQQQSNQMPISSPLKLVKQDRGRPQHQVAVVNQSIRKLDDQSESSSQYDNNSDKKSEQESALSIEARKDSKNLKFKKIAQVIFKQKMLAAFLIVGISMMFCSYFIAGYFLSVQPFEETPNILGYLDMIFLRDYNLGVSLAFSREMFVFNSTLPSSDAPNMTSADYFLRESMTSERSYLALRKSPPDVFKSITSYFEAIETNQSCSLAYYDEPKASQDVKINDCQTAYNGIMLEGTSTAISVIQRHYLKVNMHFVDVQPWERDLDFLYAGLRDQNSLQLVDLKNVHTDRAINSLKNKVTLAVSDHYQKLIGQYTTLFCVFVVAMFVMFIAFMAFGYTSIKDIMWKTNLTLKIMPLDYVPKECLPDLKAFYQY